MNRRKYLANGIALIGSSVVAGCTGSGSDDTSASDHFEKAKTAIQEANGEIKSEGEKFSSSDFESGGIDFRSAAILDYLDTAEKHLDAAEANATESQKSKIELARSWIKVARDSTEFFDILADGYSQAYSGFTYFQSERYSDAKEELETAESTLSDADDQLTVAQSNLEKIDRSKIDDLDAVSLTTLEDSFNEMEELLPALKSLTYGMMYMSSGMVDFQEGSKKSDEERYGEAESKFRDAENDFSTAHSNFKEQEDSAPQSVSSSFIELTCYSKALRDSSNHLVNAMEAIQNGNHNRADEESTKAKEALNRCDFS